MINVKELRIGNVISYNNEPSFVTTINYLQSDKSYETFFVGLKSRDTYSATIDQLEPIKLTEEILLKCGFTNRTMEHGCLHFCWNGRVVEYGVYDEDEEIYVLIDNNTIKHFHQLQNLYFILTGKDLDVNL